MEQNLEVEVTDMIEDDGRWDDANWVNEQAEISATMNAYEHGQAVG